MVVWTGLGPVLTASKPIRIIEYDCDQELRHHGYSASILGSSKKAESALREMAVRAAEIHASKPALRLCGVDVAQAVVTAKAVYPAGFGKATNESIGHIERAYRPMIKRSLGVASSFPNNVLHAATEHDGIGVPRLLGEITKMRLRHFQSTMASQNRSERQLAKAFLHSAQRWFGHSELATAPAVRLTHLLEPVVAQAPQAAHMMYELRQLGHLLCIGWEHAPHAEDGETILEAAIPDGARLTGPDLAQLQRWCREHGLVWVSELLRCDGLTPLASNGRQSRGKRNAARPHRQSHRRADACPRPPGRESDTGGMERSAGRTVIVRHGKGRAGHGSRGDRRNRSGSTPLC